MDKPVDTGPVTCVAYLEELSALAWGSVDGFVSVVELGADPAGWKKTVQTF